MRTISSSSEKKPEETAPPNTRKRGGGGSTEENSKNKSSDDGAAAGASTGKKSRVIIAPEGSSKVQEEIRRLLMHDLWWSDDDKGTITEGLMTLGGFVDDVTDDFYSPSVTSAQFILENDGVGLITILMKKNPTDADILAAGSRVLGSLMLWGYRMGRRLLGCTLTAIEKVYRLGGAETVMYAMKENPDHAYLQQMGCRFLYSFTMKEDDKRLEHSDRIQVVLDLNGLELIVAAMKKHPNDKDLQESAISALYKFCSKQRYVRLVYEAGGFSAMVSAIENHEFDSTNVVKDAIKTLHEYMQDEIWGADEAYYR